jgi:hypothetical protein
MLLANNSIFNQPAQQLLKVSHLQLASCAYYLASCAFALCLVSCILYNHFRYSEGVIPASRLKNLLKENWSLK